MKEIVLLYNVKKKSEMIKVARIAGVAVRIVENNELSQSAAYLAGVMGASAVPREYSGELKRECVLLCGLTAKKFNAVIDGMRRHRVLVDLRGVMTQQNMTWSFEKLIDELSKEKRFMTAWSKLNKIVKKMKNAPNWATELLNKEEAEAEELEEAVKKLENIKE